MEEDDDVKNNNDVSDVMIDDVARTYTTQPPPPQPRRECRRTSSHTHTRNAASLSNHRKSRQGTAPCTVHIDVHSCILHSAPLSSVQLGDESRRS